MMIRVKSGALYQWDMNRVLEIDNSDGSVAEIQISNMNANEAYVMPFTKKGKKVECCIPNILLQEATELLVCVISVDASEVKTVTHKVFYVVAKPKPSSYVYTENHRECYTLLSAEIESVKQILTANYVKNSDMEDALKTKADLVAGKVPESQLPDLLMQDELQEAVEEALQQAKESGDFNGPKGEKGEKGEPGNGGGSGVSVKIYYDETKPDDTFMFQEAMSRNRMVYVPEGEYIISEPLVIRENCEFELAQSAVLKFTMTGEENCITLMELANLKGNHATIIVPDSFKGSVIFASTKAETDRIIKLTKDRIGEEVYNSLTGTDLSDQLAITYKALIPPFKHNDPQWRRSCYVTDINICKPNSSNLHRSRDGSTSGTAIRMECFIDYIKWLWGVSMSGIRIAGAFDYGIHIQNEPSPVYEAWNHDMRIEAVIEGCKIGVRAEYCNTPHLAVAIQPCLASSNNKAYTTNGIILDNCKWVDLSSCFIWDWQKALNDTAEHRPIALYGNCPGLLVSLPTYYEGSSDISEFIYSENQNNLDKMTLLQRSGGVSKEEFEGLFNEAIEPFFQTDIVKKFTDQLAIATDTDGSIYNGIGYKKGARFNSLGDGVTIIDSEFYVITGFIPCKGGSTIRTQDITFNRLDGYTGFVVYDENLNRIANLTSSNIVNTPSSGYHNNYSASDNGFSVDILGSAVRYIRFVFHITNWGNNPVISVDEEIRYEKEGFLADSVKVKAENVIGDVGGVGVQHVTLLPETTANYDFDNYEAHVVLEPGFIFEGGKEYTVTLNGTEYVCRAQRFIAEGQYLVALGDCTVLELDGATGNGEPFVMLFTGEDLVCLMLDGSTDPITLKIEGERVTKLDKKLAPCHVITLTEENKQDGSSTFFNISGDAYEFFDILRSGIPVYFDLTLVRNHEARVLVTNYQTPGLTFEGCLALSGSNAQVFLFGMEYKVGTSEVITVVLNASD